MAVGGLILTYSPEARLREEAAAYLRAHPAIDLGPEEHGRVAVVICTDTLAGGRDLCETLIEHPGIVHLDVAYVGDEQTGAP